MNSAEYLFKKRMSYDYILKMLIQFERFKKIFFSEEQFLLFENLPKIKFDEFQDNCTGEKLELEKKIKLLSSEKSDNINKNILNIFSKLD
jgi:hypothetical protein